MISFQFLNRLLLPIWLLFASLAHAQAEPAACGIGSPACVASCGRFDKGDPRMLACEKFCGTHAEAQCDAKPQDVERADAQQGATHVRSLARKADVVDERERNGRMVEAISKGNLRHIRRLIEGEGLNPTYVYAYDFNPQTRQYDGRVVGLRLIDLFNDTNELRGDDKGLDQILALFIELGMDVTATLDQTGATADNAQSGARTAWGPSLKIIERARDRDARLRAFEIALQHGLKPNDDVNAWLFAELPQVCGHDRSQFAVQVVDLLSKYLGTSLQDDFWRAGARGPETVADVLDRMMSPGSVPRSSSERAQFAMMDEAWQNCSQLSRRINRYLMQGN
jgi:hypothetical protein